MYAIDKKEGRCGEGSEGAVFQKQRLLFRKDLPESDSCEYQGDTPKNLRSFSAEANPSPDIVSLLQLTLRGP